MKQPIAVKSKWHNGTATPAWDELWRRIFSEVLKDLPDDYLDLENRVVDAPDLEDKE